MKNKTLSKKRLVITPRGNPKNNPKESNITSNSLQSIYAGRDKVTRTKREEERYGGELSGIHAEVQKSIKVKQYFGVLFFSNRMKDLGLFGKVLDASFTWNSLRSLS